MKTHCPPHSRGASRHSSRRRGAIVVLTAFLMILMVAFLAFSIDLGYVATVRTELQRSVDAAALAGVRELAYGVDAAQEAAVEYLARNPVGRDRGSEISAFDEQLAQFQLRHADNYKISVGRWDPNAYNSLTGDYGMVLPTQTAPSAVSVFFEVPDQPLFFARALGRDTFSTRAESVAIFQPRDIVVVLDLSGSMNDDTELASINRMGRHYVESRLKEFWYELGSPSYGTLPLEPAWMKVPGVPPTSGNMPQIHVEYRYTEVFVTSTKDLSNVVLEYSNNKTQKFDGLSGKSGTFKGTGSNANRWIKRVWVKSGSNSSNDGPGYGERFDFSTTSAQRAMARKAFKLDNVPYPYPSGSWNSYIDYVISDNNANADAGYHFKFGHMNLINYWLEQKYQHNWTPDLWKVSAQPITAVKNAVNVLFDYIEEAATDDRVGLAVYDAPNGEGQVEISLTEDLSGLRSVTTRFQAGHYHNYTNIGAGMRAGRLELQGSDRSGAAQLMVLLTDGQANWRNGSMNVNAARQYVLEEAYAAAAKKIPIVTISLGAGADKDLMEQVAQITGGVHFNIPGGKSVDEYREDLLEVFRKIAAARPMRLVK